MTTFDRWLLIVANLLVGGTGVVYGVFRYFVKPDDPFAVTHPGQPLAHVAHLLAAPLLVFAIGHVFYHHALLSWKAQVREGRRSGLLMLALALPMVFSGYLLQAATDEGWRQVWIVVHVASALAWLAGYGTHVFNHARRRARAAGDA